jgi:NTE family protein
MFKPVQLLIFLLLFLPNLMYGQKVGVVLSGGGASGAAHIGVLKALEDNNIPIDYITGTSIGALVGALYASGKTPREIEALFVSDEFIKWSNGVSLDRYEFYYKQEDPSAEVVNIDFNLDTIFENNLPTSFISSVPIDFGLLQLFAPSSAAANYNFDSLFIPFRCIAADITNGKEYPFYGGNLSTAVRASMAYPFYLSPIRHNNRLLFDGGLYNNFPSDIMYHDFMPDYIIGSNVSRADLPPTEDNLISQIKSMLSKESNYSIECAKGIIIEPKVNEITLLDFEENYSAIQEGYVATISAMDSIKFHVKIRKNDSILLDERKNFISKQKILRFGSVSVDGIDEQQTNYIFNQALKGKSFFEFDKLEQSYMRLLSDRGIREIYPIATYNE